MTETTEAKKPEGSTWTDDQWKAIVTGGCNVLVAAAAGSGKTAVLVERIIRKISADTDVDRLLVATFTKAAAAEMKERIRLALEKELERSPGSVHLKRQLALMSRASITTLHSFCLDAIRRYYPLIGLDPGFRIANETEAELLRIDVLDAIFEENYLAAEENDSGFLQLVERFGGERGDEPLYALVLQLYNFGHSHPWPEAWLRETAAAFRVENAAALGRSEWVASMASIVVLSLEGAQSLLQQALELTQQPRGPRHYTSTLQEDLELVRALSKNVREQPWEKWYEYFAVGGFGKLKSSRSEDFDKEIQEQVKEIRDMAKSVITDMKDQLFMRSAEDFAAELRELAPVMQTLAELVITFGSRFEEAKREKGLIDFGDMEHYCLRILRDPASTPELTIPSAAALEYQRQFDEILLDEYQDTNMVQEAIVSLLARQGAGNRFMVGDVKQSIYRFRLAEPNLFLQKYKAYSLSESGSGSSGPDSGIRIDLARNFRSRSQVVDGVNNVFRSIMREKVAEMDYDDRAELVCGASFPPADEGGASERYEVEFALVDRGSGAKDSEAAFSSEESEDGSDSSPSSAAEEALDLQTVQLEARYIAAQIARLKGMDSVFGRGEAPFEVYDGKRRRKRSLAWRDIVILLRADKQWAPVIIEELQAYGIPAYAELSSGYFEATEVETMLSLLRVIDNPYQDIPLAGALRSPIFGLTAEELAQIRIIGGRTSYYDAVKKAAGDSLIGLTTRVKLADFLARLERWREKARRGALAELLWHIFRETGYYDLVGGMPGGIQRQANLRALHDRTRQYEATSFRGLFRFLRFIDRMRENGGDLGTARALGEQEDVVRIMSIHKSKGLEFPVVFVAGLGKLFNRQDLSGSFLMHKQLGFGPRFVDTELRVSYPTLPYLAIRERMRMETLAEEMRILYVALTRPKEKMYLVGTVADASKQLLRWQSSFDADGNIPDYRLSQAKRFIDWLGPLAVQAGISITIESADDDLSGGNADLISAAEEHLDISLDVEEAGMDKVSSFTVEQSSKITGRAWRSGIVPASLFGLEAAAAVAADEEAEAAFAERMQAVQELVPIPASPEAAAEIERRLTWSYPYPAAALIAAKTSVTEMKRLHAEAAADEDAAVVLLPEHATLSPFMETSFPLETEEGAHPQAISEPKPEQPGASVEAAFGTIPEATTAALSGGEYTFRLRRPKFMEERSLTAAERGTVSHLVMQHIPLEAPVDEGVVQETVTALLHNSMLSPEQAEAVDAGQVAAFFASDVGQRLLRASWIRRETPFSCTFPASRIYRGAAANVGEEPILIQGVIDCMFEDEHGLVLLDYKTDRIYSKDWKAAAERHRFQLSLYAEAIQMILGRTVDSCFVFFFDGGQAVKLF
ncbi:helicase-exonuclease AddAB subunit AddA [Paenibacillus nasutitermitis]|uniref:ATP-dependent helicase/nuclease subunit A n=1 Tax=Paenibacillus nasutitermitis TaxID=1652958 RepID=A0A916Z1J2_9BACL|nr:helicase-exonuclease AddAB subunit AddA [Paenibacillus nasutitermitis]GGD71563.1 ATP-dependent helicase/nuclease subunit A [Paenibacillus nasutitermitis]